MIKEPGERENRHAVRDVWLTGSHEVAPEPLCLAGVPQYSVILHVLFKPTSIAFSKTSMESSIDC